MIGLSLDDLRNLPEVTSRVEAELGHSIKEHVRNGVGVPTGQFDLRTLLAAARAFSRLVSVCTTCDGMPYDEILRRHGPSESHPCPTCNGDGLVVSPEAVERAAMARLPFISLARAEAGLRAALGIEET